MMSKRWTDYLEIRMKKLFSFSHKNIGKREEREEKVKPSLPSDRMIWRSDVQLESMENSALAWHPSRFILSNMFICLSLKIYIIPLYMKNNWKFFDALIKGVSCFDFDYNSRTSMIGLRYYGHYPSLWHVIPNFFVKFVIYIQMWCSTINISFWR